MNLSQLYQDVIIDHNNSPRNYKLLESPDREAHGHNRLCGDKITLYLKLKDNVIYAATFQGNGCAISTASASLMTEFLLGKTIDEAKYMFQQFQKAVTQDDCDTSQLGKLAALTGVRAFPSRVKCATLAWHTLLAALTQDETCVSTE